MTTLSRAVLAAVLAACSAPPSHPHPISATLAFTHVRVFDGHRTVPDTTVLIDGDRIAAVAADLAAPAGATVIDGHGRTLLPGLIDAHVHAYDKATLVQSLAFGVTTVLEMFGFPDNIKKLRQDPALDHADLRSAGILATAPHGHGTEYGTEIPTLTRPEDAQPWVDARIAEGSDYIKIVLDDGRAYGWQIPTLDTATFTAVVDAAHRRGKLAVVHIGDQHSARTAIEHGADGLVHLFGDAKPQQDFGALVAAHHAFVTPTIVVTNTIYGIPSVIGRDPAIAPYLMPDAQSTLRQSYGQISKGPPGAIAETIVQLRDAGVSVLCGTDAPNPGTAFGASMHEELALLVAAGLSPSAALTAATAAPAERFGLTDRGRIAAGARADLVLVDGDPTRDIEATRRIAGVWRGGHRFDRDAYRARVAAAVAKDAAERVHGTPGLVSDFAAGPAARLGQAWTAYHDASSTAAVRTSAGALEITGELVIGKSWAMAGAIWYPGHTPFSFADLSATRGFSFLARGDGKPYTVKVFTERRGFAPSTKKIQPGAAFARLQFTWSDFDGLDGRDVTAVFIGQDGAPGAFALAIDDFALD